MNILLLAPQPFFQERGTPIAVRLAAQVLSKREGDVIDLLTYHEGSEVSIPNVNIHRIRVPGIIKNIGPGISIKKLICDLFFALYALRLAGRNAYQLVHAVEESVFVALLIKMMWKIPYLYDMDSSLALQLTEKWWLLRPLRPLFEFSERLAVRSSLAVVPVCDALAVIANRHGSAHTTVLSDISLLEEDNCSGSVEYLKTRLELAPDTVLSLYIGNLERYQGIDLMLEAAASLDRNINHALVIIGGRDEHIRLYNEKVLRLGLAGKVFFLGPRPVSALSDYLPQADILVSPRTTGNNTPMKIYSYLHSGVVILATNLPTHHQVLTPQVSMLAEATACGFAAAWRELIEKPELRRKLGRAAHCLAEERYTFPHFERTLNSIYDHVKSRLGELSTDV